MRHVIFIILILCFLTIPPYAQGGPGQDGGGDSESWYNETWGHTVFQSSYTHNYRYTPGGLSGTNLFFHELPSGFVGVSSDPLLPGYYMGDNFQNAHVYFGRKYHINPSASPLVLKGQYLGSWPVPGNVNRGSLSGVAHPIDGRY